MDHAIFPRLLIAYLSRSCQPSLLQLRWTDREFEDCKKIAVHRPSRIVLRPTHSKASDPSLFNVCSIFRVSTFTCRLYMQRHLLYCPWVRFIIWNITLSVLLLYIWGPWNVAGWIICSGSLERVNHDRRHMHHVRCELKIILSKSLQAQFSRHLLRGLVAGIDILAFPSHS